ncbi:hypothetical protein C8Q79DRAFT_223618 [Trametes meyenii]|nr:hypothetical protein C8Q79DRAFT_223618 [Trametes meyenii]
MRGAEDELEIAGEGQPRACTPAADVPSLPADILHAVLRSLQADKAALLACATTSRLWRDVSCPYLFASLTVIHESKSDLELGVFRGFLDARPDLAVSVRELVIADSPLTDGDSEDGSSEDSDDSSEGSGSEIEDSENEDSDDDTGDDEGESEEADTEHEHDSNEGEGGVQYEDGEKESKTEDGTLSQGSTKGIDALTLAAIVGRLPRLRMLTLRKICFTFSKTTDEDGTSLPSSLNSSVKLPKLVVYTCSRGTRGHSCTNILTLFNLLAVLNPEDVLLEPFSLDFRARSHPRYDRRRLLRPLEMRKLTADTRGLNYDGFDNKNQAFLPLFSALRQSLAPGTLTSLDLSNVWRMNHMYYEKFMLALGKLLAHVSSSLLHFRYPLSLTLGADASPDYWAVLNLQQCTKLTSLSLQVEIWPERTVSSTPPSAALAALLSHISPTLRSITVVVDMCRGVDRIRGPLYDLTDALDEALTSAGRFPALQRVYAPLRILSSSDRNRLLKACLDIAERTVPRLRARSGVRVQLGFDPSQKF